jgi:hypothetical protein
VRARYCAWARKSNVFAADCAARNQTVFRSGGYRMAGAGPAVAGGRSPPQANEENREGTERTKQIIAKS